MDGWIFSQRRQRFFAELKKETVVAATRGSRLLPLAAECPNFVHQIIQSFALVVVVYNGDDLTAQNRCLLLLFLRGLLTTNDRGVVDYPCVVVVVVVVDDDVVVDIVVDVPVHVSDHVQTFVVVVVVVVVW